MSKLTDNLDAALLEEEKQVNALIDRQSNTTAGSAQWAQLQKQITELGKRCADLKRDIAELKAP